MTEQPRPAPAEPPQPPPGQPSTPTASFTAHATDQARTYQAGRDLHEHHHYPPSPPAPARPNRPVPAGVTWSLVTAAILALGTVTGVVLWERHKTPATGPATATGPTGTTTPASPTATTPRPSPSPDRPTGAPTTPTATPTERPAAPAASTDPADSGPVPNPAAGNCRSWTTSPQAPGVQVRSCARREGDRLYMVGEWRTTSGHALVDVYLWLEDSAKKVVYPGPDKRSGIGFHAMPAYPTPRDDAPQWREIEVRQDLVRGERYQVCAYVITADGPAPEAASPGTTGLQYGITYR
ncbi:hypothetical protein ACGH2B_16875 [Streptomyces sp. BBFR2]|uniref:hypothetical protein n=1 Tax=Streptomyces sp. BBFR2 TaxID=3372854 RepID=UPI0037DA4053